MTFVARKIDIAIKLAENTQTNQPTTFAETSSDSITLSGHRASVRVQNSGYVTGTEAQVTIWGLSQSLMNQLSTLGMVINIVPKNTITITVGDEGGSMSTVFVGTIVDAYGDYQGAPDAPFRMNCRATAAEQVIPFPVSSYTGATDVATALSAIASRANWGFENSGIVGVTLSNPYFVGSAATQVQTIREHAGINAEVINNVLCIWPLYGNRTSPEGPPLISPTTGMIGYPSFTQQGIMIKSVYNPAIRFGGQIKVKSSIFTKQSLERINNAESLWDVKKLDLALDALLPRGQWESTVYGYNPGKPQPLPPQTQS